MVYLVWTPKLDELLVELREAGLKWAVVAKRLGKTQEATISRARILNLRMRHDKETPPLDERVLAP